MGQVLGREEEAEVERVSFSLVTPDDAAYESVVTITDGGPKRRRGTIADERMGCEEGKECPTCHSRDCLGHSGLIKLPQPVPNLEYRRRLLGVLNAVCWKCSRIRLERDSVAWSECVHRSGTWRRNKQNARVEELWRRITKASEKIAQCLPAPDPEASPCYNPGAGCGAMQPHWEIDGGLCLRAIFPTDDPPQLNAEDVQRCLNSISSEDCETLGLGGSAVGLMWTALPVLSNQLRHSDKKESSLTNQLRRIVRASERVKTSGILSCKAGHRTKVDPAYRQLVQFVALYQNSDTRPSTQKKYGNPESIRTRLGRRKQARIRASAGSKRGDWTIRMVVSPSTLIHVREIGVPEFACMRVTYGMRVQAYNLEFARKLCANGPHKYPGAHPPAHGGEVKCGDVIERHLINGDYVLVNRQPTLGLASLRAHRVKVQKRNSHVLEIHTAAVFGYGMDFDGDEANLCVVRTEEGRAEADQLMLVDHHILKDGIPFGLVFNQSGILGAHTLTLDSTRVSRADLSQMLMLDEYFDAAIRDGIPPGETFEGREVFSLFLPAGLNVHCAGVVVECNEHVSVQTEGTWSAESLNGPAGLIAAVHEKYGGTHTANFVTAVYRACVWYGVHVRPTTVSYEDCLRGEGGLQTLIKSGAKGKPENITQIRDALGQQHDHKGRPFVGGLIVHGFARGLDPFEHFFHLASSRACLTDTAVMTGKSGYLTRQCAKMFEDLTLSYKPGVVVNSSGREVYSNYEGGVPGDMVGLHAAYAIVGPCTQINLKTFHASGASNALVAAVPRLQSLLWMTAPEVANLRDEDGRRLLAEEIRKVLKIAGVNVPRQHVDLITSAMMAPNGRLLPITHAGATKQKIGVLRLAGFERSAEVLLAAAAQGQTDPLQGPWERVLFNRRFPGGTGAFELIE